MVEDSTHGQPRRSLEIVSGLRSSEFARSGCGERIIHRNAVRARMGSEVVVELLSLINAYLLDLPRGKLASDGHVNEGRRVLVEP